MEHSKFAFLGAPRFWAMVVGAVAIYLQSKGLIGDPEMLLIATLSAGFIGINTIDRSVETIAQG